MSCELPNLQQIPKSTDKPWNGQMKQAFVAKDGYELWEFDYKQLELRLATAYGKDQDLLDIFADPERDVFDEMAAILGMTRKDTKTLAYAIQYGAGAKHLSYVFRCSYKEASDRIEYFYHRFPGFRKASDRAKLAVRNLKGKLKIWSGRFRHFQSPKEWHKAFNSAIQGGAADIVERQMIKVVDGGWSDGERSRMLLQIHDSIVMEIRKDIVAEAVPAITAIMENVEPDFGVRFAVDAHRWGE
jgi:DNA polymerase-1